MFVLGRFFLWHRLALAAVLVVIALAACGGSATPQATPAWVAAPTTTTAPIAPSAQVPSPTAPAPAASSMIKSSSPTLPPVTGTPASLEPTETPIPATATPSPLPEAVSPTAAATVAPTATLRAASATPVPAPRVLSFAVAPATTLNVGDLLHFTWQATGARAELCPLLGAGPADRLCWAVPLKGSTTYTTQEKDMLYVGFVLRAWSGKANQLAAVNVRLQCQNLRPWFFSSPPLRCPAAEADLSYAAAEHFEHGLMIWIENTDTFYVFYAEPDAAGFQTFVWTSDLQLKPGASPDHRSGETPPSGLYEPVSGFGLIWRGEADWPNAADARQRLGWATEPEFGFDTATQCETGSGLHLWSCYLRAPGGHVLHLRPDSSAQVRFLWQEWQ